MAARCRRSDDCGVAVATARPAVGALVPWVSRQAAIATQARVNTDLGRHGLLLVEHGVPIGPALAGLIEADPERELRQLHGVDARGTFAHTGARCVEWCGHLAGDGFTVAGNMLVAEGVIKAMAEAFLASEREELAARLMRALEAGQAAGGDKRGRQSAALLVAAEWPRGSHNLRVDDHADPVAELRRVYEVAVVHWRRVGAEYGPEGQRLFGRIKY
ncbi:MAG: DUF1028 domain-containing protein [Candidatus Rokubacteria bacterium]|nr:DUF1028 domain-containing protein [Candidatus Rokubacteria bacterium]